MKSLPTLWPSCRLESTNSCFPPIITHSSQATATW